MKAVGCGLADEAVDVSQLIWLLVLTSLTSQEIVCGGREGTDH